LNLSVLLTAELLDSFASIHFKFLFVTFNYKTVFAMNFSCVNFVFTSFAVDTALFSI